MIESLLRQSIICSKNGSNPIKKIRFATNAAVAIKTKIAIKILLIKISKCGLKSDNPHFSA